MRYFHVDTPAAAARPSFLNVGDVVRTSDRSCNPYYEKICTNFHYEIPLGRLGSRPLLKFFGGPEVTLRSHAELAGDAFGVLEPYIRLVREMEFENIRRSEFANLPSRTRGIWLSADLVQARYWQQRIAKKTATRLISVEVDGIVHHTQGTHLPYDSVSMLELQAAARCYWRGDPHPRPEPEYLFEGCMTVVEIHS